MDALQIASIILPFAWPIGLGLLLATALSRVLQRGVGPVILAVGLAATGYLAFAEWQVGHASLVLVGILLFAILLSAVGAWSLRRPAPVLELAILAVAWYLVLQGTVGTAFVATTTGSLAWALLVLLTMIVTERPVPAEESRKGAEAGKGEIPADEASRSPVLVGSEGLRVLDVNAALLAGVGGRPV